MGAVGGGAREAASGCRSQVRVSSFTQLFHKSGQGARQMRRDIFFLVDYTAVDVWRVT